MCDCQNCDQDCKKDRIDHIVEAHIITAKLGVLSKFELIAADGSGKPWREIIQRLNPKVIDKAGGCSPKLRRSDARKGLWAFAVNCPVKGSGQTHAVKIQAIPYKKEIEVGRLPINVTCDCKAFIYWGADYNANSGKYLYGPKKSDGSAPNIRDPGRINTVCKHIYSVIEDLAKRYRVQG